MTPCEELGYEEGDLFEVISDDHYAYEKGSLVVLKEDDGSETPLFVASKAALKMHWAQDPDDFHYIGLDKVQPYNYIYRFKAGDKVVVVDYDPDYDCAKRGSLLELEEGGKKVCEARIIRGEASSKHREGYTFVDMTKVKPYVPKEQRETCKRIKQKPETRKKTDLTLVYKDLSQHTFKNVQAVNETEQYLTITCTKEIAEGISEVTNTYIDKSIALSFLMEKPAGEYVLKDLHKEGKKEFSGGVKILF